MSRSTALPTGVPLVPAGVSRPAAPAAPAPTLTVREVMGIIRRRMWWIAGITLFSMAVFVVLWYVFLRYYPRYTSMGLIQCKMPVQRDILSGAELIPNDRIIELEVKGKATMIRSESFLSSLLVRTKVQATSWYRSFDSNVPKMMKDLKENFGAYPQRDTDLLLVNMTTSNPEEARIIVDEALDQFITDMEQNARQVMRDNLESLRREKDKVERDIALKRQTLSTLSARANAPGWQQGQTESMQQMQTMLMEKMTLEAQLKQALFQREQLQQEKQQSGVTSRVLFAVQQDPMVMGLNNRILGLAEERDNLRERFGADHPQVKGVEARIASAQQSLNERSQQLQQQFGGSELISLDREIQSLQSDLNSVNAQLSNAKERQAEVERVMADYLMAKEELDYLNRSLEKFDERIYSTTVASNNPDLVSVKIFSRGYLPKEVSFPRLTFFLPVGIVVGLLLSAGLIGLLEFSDDSIKTPSDIRRHLNIPMLGMIPEYEEDDAEQIAVAKVMMLHPHAMISDMYRKMRTNLFFSAPAEELKSILVSGCTADCGNTTTAVNLAVTLASEGRRVLLVDANFRRPAIAQLFPSDGASRGLSNILVGQATAADVIRSSGLEGLDVVDAGPLPPNPADLLHHPRMKEFLDRQKEFYDHVILDGPPALLVSDARILSGLADRTVLVVRAEETSRGMAQRMVRELQSPRIRILGLILNAVKPRKGGYFQQEIESYREYVEAKTSTRVSLPAGTNPSPKAS